MKNIILTGASGFVGRYVLKQLIEEGYFVIALIRNKDNEKELLDFIGLNAESISNLLLFIVSSMEDVDLVQFPSIGYFAWIHLAWGGVNREYIDDDEFQRLNYYNSVSCLQMAHKIGCQKFIESGSRAECGDDLEVIPEAMAGNPLNAYGKYKKQFYEYAFDFCCKHNIEYLHLRLFAVTGPGDHPWSLVSSCCDKFKKNESMNLGSCEQMWNYIDVRDASLLLIFLINNYKFEHNDNCIINVASSDSKVLKDFIKIIYCITKSSSEVNYSSVRGFDSNPCVDKVKKIYDLNKNISFHDTVIEMIDD